MLVSSVMKLINRTDNFYIRTMHLDTIKVFFYSPTNAQMCRCVYVALFYSRTVRHTGTHNDQDATNIRSHITADLIIHRCTIVDCFNKV